MLLGKLIGWRSKDVSPYTELVRVHLYFARAKHFGRQFISESQRFTTEMLRPYEYICKNEMHQLIILP